MEKIDKVVVSIEDFLNHDHVNLGSNLALLLKDYKRKSKRLERIIKQSDKQQRVLVELNEELDKYKNHLEKKVEEEIKKREEKEKMLFQQSKLAAMGEMMDAVAHQWKQPISLIKMDVEMLGYDFEDGLVDAKYIPKYQNKVLSQIDHITDTLSEFRSFFRPNKEIEEFKIKDMIQKVLLLIKDELIKNSVEIKLKVKSDFTIMGIENEFKHLVLNILNNAKDAFVERNIKPRVIVINVLGDEKIIEIQDNAGGISEDVIGDIFKANVTTKEEGKGTGIGLYMSSQIAIKHRGTLSVENIDEGAKFIFKMVGTV